MEKNCLVSLFGMFPYLQDHYIRIKDDHSEVKQTVTQFQVFGTGVYTIKGILVGATLWHHGTDIGLRDVLVLVLFASVYLNAGVGMSFVYITEYFWCDLDFPSISVRFCSVRWNDSSGLASTRLERKKKEKIHFLP